MVQRPDGPGLLLESAQAFRVRCHRLAQDLDRHLAPEPRVERPVDLSHPSRAERRQDLVGAETSPDCQGHDEENLGHCLDNIPRCT